MQATLTAEAPRPAAVPEPDELHATWDEELTLETGRRFGLLIDILLRGTPDVITLDLRECPYLSEEGVSALLDARRACAAAGVRLRVLTAGQPARSLDTKQVARLFA